MKKMVKKSLLLLTLISSRGLHSVSPYINIRSQSVDSARMAVGLTDKINLYDMENMYLTASITLEGTRSFNSDSIVHNLFGTFNCNSAPSVNGDYQPSINVSGSAVPGRGATDWLADYFGLPTTFQSTLWFKPVISNLILDFDFYVGLDEWYPGLYFRAQAPFVSTHWDLNFTEKVTPSNLTPAGYIAGYMSPGAVPVANLLPTAQAFLSDQKTPTLVGVTIGSTSYNTSFAPLEYGVFERTRQNKSALSDMQFVLGWNCFQDENYHLGVNFQVYAPTGNRPNGLLLFQPIVGNGKHWAVGGGLSSHYTFWQTEDEESSMGVYLDANFTHLCATHQMRSFDLKNKPLSRYMLAELMGTNVQNLYAQQGGSGVAPTSQFQNALVPVINITTLPVNSSFGVQADITGLFNYYYYGLSIDVGYNFWALSCETITSRDDVQTLFTTSGPWALKGDAQVYGYAGAGATITPGTPVPLSATESEATIYAGTNAGSTVNAGIDNAFPAQVTSNNAGQLLYNQSGGGSQINTSYQPELFTSSDIDYDGARTKGLSNKVFAHISYTWTECDEILPYLGIGGKAEFGPRHHERTCNSSNPTAPVITACDATNSSACGGCHRTNISEWGLWVKGGIFFY